METNNNITVKNNNANFMHLISITCEHLELKVNVHTEAVNFKTTFVHFMTLHLSEI
jgi:hypothetical protein